jgi:hypothetical protein
LLCLTGVACDAGGGEPVPRDHFGESAPPEQPCDLVARASVYFVPVRVQDDFSLSVEVDAVWYEHEGQTYEATCLPERDGSCLAWVAGWEREGEIRVWTDYCEVVVETVRTVPIDETGCHVETQYVLQPVSTRGCLVSSPS